MKSKLTRILSLLLALFILVSCVAPLASCKGGNGDNGGGNTDDPNKTPSGGGETSVADYTVSVSSYYGMPLKNVVAVVYDSENASEGSVDQARTDAKGKATFKLDSSKKYYVSLEAVPEGYIKGENRFEFDPTKFANIKLSSAPISDGDITDVDMYEVGDVIHDFFITDVTGEEWLISSVLEERQLLVLNFWFSTCGPCQSEFPYIISAYNKYNGVHGDVLEIFAINDKGEDKSVIQNFAVDVYDKDGNGVKTKLPFPTFKAEESGFGTSELCSRFYRQINAATGLEEAAYPISVFIDRAGVICCIEVGAVPNEKAFTNAFDHFTAADYKQKIVNSIADFTPIEKPNVEAPSFEEIDAALTGMNEKTGEKLQVSYRWDKDEYNWPFVVDVLGNSQCIRPANIDKDNSFAVLYADVYLEAGDALIFDYLSSTQNSSLGSDDLVMIVDGKNIIEIRGLDTLPAEGEDGNWHTCCTFVAKESKTYEVAFCYLKDSADYMGEDGVFIKNLRVIDESNVDTETYIFRYAATDPDEFGVGFNSYVDVVLGSDGYYHVGNENGPLLLAMLLNTYTQFDTQKTVFERLFDNTDDYGNVIFEVDGVDCWAKMEKYGSYASNSDLPGYTPITEELGRFLKRYVEMFAAVVGEEKNENLWLQLCCYYDAYGTDGKQLDDPIKGLAFFSAPEMPVGEKITVTYNTIVIPRGYLYAFTPAEDGVYRITTYSKSATIGWIFTATDDNGAGERVLYADSESGERIAPELTFNGYKVVCPVCQKDLIYPKQFDAEGNEVNPTNLHCDDPFCIDETTGASPIVTDFSRKIEVYSIDRENISMVEHFKAGTTYYIAVAFFNVEELGSFDFEMKYVGKTFDKFTYASPGSFTFEMDETGTIGQTTAGGIKVKLCDIEGCQDCAEMAVKLDAAPDTKYYHSVNKDGSLGYLVFVDFHMPTSIYPENSLKDVLNKNGFNFTHTPSKSALDEEAENILNTAENKGISALYSKWKAEDPTLTEDDLNTIWLDYSMFEVMKGNTSALEGLDNSEELIRQALEWKEYVEAVADQWLHDYFGDEYDAKYEEYKMDDIKKGIYHGEAIDYTEVVRGYVEKLLDEPGFPERQGCIAVDETLAHILQLHMDIHTFSGVENSWVKLCYYYDRLGQD